MPMQKKSDLSDYERAQLDRMYADRALDMTSIPDDNEYYILWIEKNSELFRREWNKNV